MNLKTAFIYSWIFLAAVIAGCLCPPLLLGLLTIPWFRKRNARKRSEWAELRKHNAKIRWIESL